MTGMLSHWVTKPLGMQASSIGNKSVPIQLAQCWFPGLAISNAKIKIFFKYNIRKPFYQTAHGHHCGLKLAKC